MTYSLSAEARTKQADALRAEGNIPLVVYGPSSETTSISCDRQTFARLYEQAGTSNLITLEIDGNAVGKVLIKDFQIHPTTREFTHADLYQVDMNKELTSDISLNFIGESPAVKKGGTLLVSKESIHVRCLPDALVDHIDVDLSTLVNFEDSLHVEHLTIPAGLTVEDDADILLAKVSAPLTAAQLEAMEQSEEKSVDEVASAEGEKPAEE